MPAEETILDDKEKAESSPATPDVNTEASSSSEDEKSLSDIVSETALKHSEKESESSTEKEEASPEDQAAKEEPGKVADKQETQSEKQKTEDDKSGKQDDSKLPFHTHPRWKEVLSERDTARAEIAQLKPKVETFDALTRYCQTNGISQEDLREALELTAMAKKDVPAFRKRMHEYLENVDVALGERLPSDLQKKVDDGLIDIDTAKELSQSRLRLKHSELEGHTAAERSARELQTAISGALNNWEESIRKGDPDYDKRREMLQDRITSLWTANPPTTVQGAIQIAEQAYKDIKERLSKFLPKPPPRKVLTSNGSSTNNGEDFQLDSLDDLGKLVRNVAARHR